jgi:hypothetical protein
MTNRKPIQIPRDFALCEDGTMWIRVKSSGGMLDPFIPAYWEKVDDIPSDEEYEKQVKQREEIWNNHYNELEGKMKTQLRL